MEQCVVLFFFSLKSIAYFGILHGIGLYSVLLTTNLPGGASTTSVGLCGFIDGSMAIYMFTLCYKTTCLFPELYVDMQR
jgi:uncharacterized membrane protein